MHYFLSLDMICMHRSGDARRCMQRLMPRHPAQTDVCAGALWRDLQEWREGRRERYYSFMMGGWGSFNNWIQMNVSWACL